MLVQESKAILQNNQPGHMGSLILLELDAYEKRKVTFLTGLSSVSFKKYTNELISR